jgi:hypothetical protein
MVQMQLVRDRRIFDLVATMESTYSFVVSGDESKNSGILQGIVERILNQTIECGYFIQEYIRHNLGGMWQFCGQHNNRVTRYQSERVISQPFSGVDDQITAFCTAFTDLSKNLDSGRNLSTPLVLFRDTATIDTIGAYIETC